MRWTLAVLCLFSWPLWAQIDDRVENGDVVAVAHPLTKSVALFTLGGGTCSASFLTDKVLLTAGHCTKGKSASATSVRVKTGVGKWHTVKVAKLITHPNYKIDKLPDGGAKVNNDIGLVFLQESFPFAIRPLKLASAAQLRRERTAVTVVGYGKNSSFGGSGVLRTGKMIGEVFEIENFFDREGIFMVAADDQIVCPGDSGGAVLKGDAYSTQLIGVNSLSSGCQGGDVGEQRSMSEIALSHRTWIRSVAPSVP